MVADTQILILAGAAVVAFGGVSLNRGLKMRDDKRPVAELLWYSGGLIPLAGVCLVWAGMGDQPVTAQRIILFVIGAAIGGIGLVGIGEYVRPAQAQYTGTAAPQGDGPTINTWNQSGGNNTINVGPQRLPFDPGLAAELASKLPAGKVIALQSIGSHADQVVADQYQQYLESKGFKVERMYVGMMAPPPDHKITLGDPNAAKMVVIISPSGD
ncbi:MAG TPA: hypothetical protein VHX86_02715 [Tepidisphaeraceae bacterium]|jgi:hypothetical protein|nr:hypothetical protein [Tepidisphaeraceae bacterium]